MTLAAIKSLQEAVGQKSYKEIARENRALRARLREVTELAEGFYYGPYGNAAAFAYDNREPIAIARARAALAGDLRKKVWISRAIAQKIAINRRLRKLPMKVTHTLKGLGIFLIGIGSAKIGIATGWWEPSATLPVVMGAFGGFMAGGAAMWSSIVFRRAGIR